MPPSRFEASREYLDNLVAAAEKGNREALARLRLHLAFSVQEGKDEYITLMGKAMNRVSDHMYYGCEIPETRDEIS